jgi:organic hydroperoxide reductase OsmC/OhrA
LEIVMAIRMAEAEWDGDLPNGSGHMRFGSDAFDGPYDFRFRMGEGKGTNPEELLGATDAGCFSTALARSRELCPESTFICEPSSCKFQRIDHCPYIFDWHASPG